MLIRAYPTRRMDWQLDDLKVAQRLFAENKETCPNHLEILTNGSGRQLKKNNAQSLNRT